MNAPHTAGTLDCVDEAMLVLAYDTNAGEVGTHDPKQGKENPQRARQSRAPCLELGNADVKGRDRLIEAGCRRDGRMRAPEPARHRRARDTDPSGDGGITRVSDEAQETMVVASLGSFG